MSKETLVGLDSVRKNQSLTILACTSEECQVLLMALGELLGSVQREEHLLPMIHSLIQRVEGSRNTLLDTSDLQGTRAIVEGGD